MELKMEQILFLMIKKTSLITLLISILLLSIAGFLYWKYLYLTLEFLPEATVENKIEEVTLNKIIKNIDQREDKYLRSLKTGYKNPFQ